MPTARMTILFYVPVASPFLSHKRGAAHIVKQWQTQHIFLNLREVNTMCLCDCFKDNWIVILVIILIFLCMCGGEDEGCRC